MPKTQRMTRADFSSLGSVKSRRYFGAYFSLSVAPLPASNTVREPKYACVVSKKVAADAVDRNLIKRRCREACRKIGLSTKKDQQGLTSGGPTSFVFYAKKEAKTATSSAIEEDVRTLISQAT